MKVTDTKILGVRESDTGNNSPVFLVSRTSDTDTYTRILKVRKSDTETDTHSFWCRNSTLTPKILVSGLSLPVILTNFFKRSIIRKVKFKNRTSTEEKYAAKISAGNITSPIPQPQTDLSFLDYITSDRYAERIVYVVFVCVLLVAGIVRALAYFRMCYTASVNIHRELFRATLRAPMSYFDRNPVGRILNRFSKDMGIADDVLPPTLYEAIDVNISKFSTSILCGHEHFVIQFLNQVM